MTMLVGGRSALLVLVCLAVLPPHPAAAQDRTPTPSGAELRETYPLRPSTTPEVERSAAPTGTASASGSGSGSGSQPADRGTASDGAAPIALLAVFAFVAAMAVLGLSWLRHRRARPAQTATPPMRERRANGRAPEPAPDTALPTAVMPPDAHRRWTATIEWRETDGASRFSVVARAARGSIETVLAESAPVEWPPATPDSVQALGAAASTLERSLAAAGWKALPSGHEWYAKRFAWEPVAGEPSGSPTATPGPRAFARRAG
jgi:hypothetical protein